MRLILLEQLDPSKLAKALSRYAIFLKFKTNINREQSNLDNDGIISQPNRSGNLETPNPEHWSMMGQSPNPHGTRADKRGRTPSITGSSRKSSESPVNTDNTGIHQSQQETRPSMTSLGQPFDRGLSDDPLDDGADVMPVDKGGMNYHTRREGPAEDPGTKRDGSLGFNRSKRGLTRYVG